jgi:predicted DNA-binding transcriptional regulator AlpA
MSVSTKDEAEALPLPRFVRYRHLHEAGIAASWKSLYELIDKYGFPPGIFISPNVRAWDVSDVERWLAKRPSERKAVPSRWHREREIQ